MTRLLGVLLASVVLAGCATTKTELSENGYEDYAASYVYTFKCKESGKISEDTAEKAIVLINRRVNAYFYFPERLTAFVELKQSENVVPDERDCNKVVNAVREQSSKNITYNQGSQGVTNYNLNIPKHTVCNLVGNQTMCTTY